MTANAHSSTRKNPILRALTIFGLAFAIAGFGFDLLPGARPGFNSLQIAVIVLGAVSALIGVLGQHWRPENSAGFARDSLKVVLIILLTCVGLELALVAVGYPTYFPIAVPEEFLQPAPWWTCGDMGCHHIPDAMAEACQSGQVSGRRCIVNQQGYHDSQDFAAGADFGGRTRILTLGDSFTFGLTADIGMSYVETLEKQLPDAVVWNTGIPFLGTNQALLAFKRVAPILKPQLTIYGFYGNDFDDNLTPVDGYFIGIDEEDETYAIQQYHVDPWGNATKLEEQVVLYYRLHGVEAPANKFERLVGTTRLGSVFISSIDSAGKLLGIAQRTLLERKVELTRGFLKSLRDSATAQDTRLLILLIPSKQDLKEQGTHFKTAIELFTELGIPYLNPINALDLERDYAPDGHWNSVGHQRIGLILSDCVRAFIASQEFAECRYGQLPAP